MIFVKEKIKRNKRIAIWILLGFLIMELVLCGMWISIMVAYTSSISWIILIPAAITIAWAYIGGVIIKGMENKSFGIDIANMDETEIEIVIGLLEKEKKSRVEQ